MIYRNLLRFAKYANKEAGSADLRFSGPGFERSVPRSICISSPRPQRRRSALPVLALAAFVVAFLPRGAVAAGASGEGQPKVTPDIVRMGAFYGGARLRVEGTTAPETKIIVMVRGGTVTEAFNKVGRVGPIWVNTGKVTVRNTPSLLLVFSSIPVSDCLPRAIIDKYGLDQLAVKKQMHIESKAPDYERIADDYLLYKIRQGSYQLVHGNIQMKPPDEDGLSYSLEFTLPKTVAAGKYVISVLECQGGEIVRVTDLPIQVVEVGFPAMVAWLAAQHPSAYGIAAVVIAMIAGFGIDFIAAHVFKRKIVGH